MKRKPYNRVNDIYEFVKDFFIENKKMPSVFRVAKHFGITTVRIYQYYNILALNKKMIRPKEWQIII
jgi:uncharacterized HAD superfamily protein